MNTFSNRSYPDGRVVVAAANKLPDVLTEMDDHEIKSRPSKKMKLVGLSILAKKTKEIGDAATATGAATATVAPSKKKNNNKLPITIMAPQQEEHHDMKSHDCATTAETPGLKPLVFDHPCQEALGGIATMETNKNDKKTTRRQSPRRGKKGNGNSNSNSNNKKTTANSSPTKKQTKKQIQFAVDGKAASRNKNKSKIRSPPQQWTPPPAARATHPATPPTESEVAKKRAQVLADYREIDAMLLSEWD